MAYSLTYAYNSTSESYTVTGYSNITTSDKVVIPSTYDDGTNGEHPVTSIGSSAFENCNGLTSVTIPDSVTFIGWKAFSGCSKLTSITIPDSVTGIGDYAFYTCSSLTSVNIPDGVTKIGNSTFYNCSSLMSVTIGNGVTSIGNYAFSDCIGLTSVTIPDSVTSIGEFAFSNCSRLTSVNIPDGVTSIGDNTFYSCSKLTSVTIPNSVTSIGNMAFWGCHGLTSVTIGNGVTSIGYEAFLGCIGLTSVTIPDRVTKIGSYTFSHCKSLMSVTIPDKVTSIGNYAFSDCIGLTSVIIGNSVTSIDSNVFYDCTSLKQLILFPSTPPTLGSSAIPTTISKIYVQQSSKTAYQSATNWTTFASKIVSDNIYLSFVRFNQKNKEYIEKKINDFKGDKVDKGDLSADVNASLAKADSSLQKPTATLAKESFVKVGIDGTQKFDENSYVIAPSTDGTAGQVLKKTAAGTEWADESGGGGGGGAKLYLHKIIATFSNHPADIYLSIINNSTTPLTESSQLKTYIGDGIPAYYNGSAGMGAVSINRYSLTSNEFSVRGAVIDYSSNLAPINFQEAFSNIVDTVTEL